MKTYNSYPHKEVTMLTHESEQLISLARADLEATVKEQAAEISELKRWRTSGIERSAKDSDIVSLYRQQLAAAQTEIELLKSQVNFWISEQSEQVTRTNAEIDDSNDLHQQLAEARAEITRLVEEIADHVKARASDRASRLMSKDKTVTLAGAKKPDLSSLTDDKLRESIKTMAAEVRERHSILHYCQRELKRRTKACENQKNLL